MVNISSKKFYTLYGKTVYVMNINIFGNDEYRVEYISDKGSKNGYVGTGKDIEEDFKETEDSFKVKMKKEKSKKSSINDKTYDLVYYLGKRKVETIQSNINIILANGLKRQYSSFPNYELGELRVIPNK